MSASSGDPRFHVLNLDCLRALEEDPATDEAELLALRQEIKRREAAAASRPRVELEAAESDDEEAARVPPPSASSDAAARPPLAACSNAALIADMRRFWQRTAPGARRSPEMTQFNGWPMDVAMLYRGVCSMGGLGPSLACATSPAPYWSRVFSTMSNANANPRGRPTGASNALSTFYRAHLLPYEQAHPEDVTTPECSLCGLNEAPAPQPSKPMWRAVWRACGGCRKWLHKACAELEGTTMQRQIGLTGAADGMRSFCSQGCMPRGSRLTAAAARKQPGRRAAAASDAESDEDVVDAEEAADEDGDDGYADEAGGSGRAGGATWHASASEAIVQFLPPRCGRRLFPTCRNRCSPNVPDHVRHEALLHAAHAVLVRAGLTDELVRAALGFTKASVDASKITVALLLPPDHAELAEPTVLSAVVICDDVLAVKARDRAAQVLVAATAQEERRNGYMRHLLNEVSARLAADGVELLCLGTTRANVRAAACYQSLGFSQSATGWPTGFQPQLISKDVKLVWTRPCAGGMPAPAPPPARRRAIATPVKRDAPAPPRRVAGGAAMSDDGPPLEWPGEVPFTSAPVWEGQPRATWPQQQCGAVEVRRITWRSHPCYGRYGVFARGNIEASDKPRLSYAGEIRRRRPTDSLYVADAGGGLDVDAGPVGNEGRYLNHYEGIASRPNCQLMARQDPCTGIRWVAVLVTRRVHAGAELLIDYGSGYPKHLLQPHAGQSAASVPEESLDGLPPPRRLHAGDKRKMRSGGDALLRVGSKHARMAAAQHDADEDEDEDEDSGGAGPSFPLIAPYEEEEEAADVEEEEEAEDNDGAGGSAPADADEDDEDVEDSAEAEPAFAVAAAEEEEEADGAAAAAVAAAAADAAPSTSEGFELVESGAGAAAAGDDAGEVKSPASGRAAAAPAAPAARRRRASAPARAPAARRQEPEVISLLSDDEDE